MQILNQRKERGITGIVGHVPDAVVMVGQRYACPHCTFGDEDRVGLPDAAVEPPDYCRSVFGKGIDRCGYRTCQ